MMYINSYVQINECSVSLNGKSIVLNESDRGSSYLSQLYHHLSLDYPKFFKMDTLCKAGFLASELLLGAPMDKPTNEWAVISFSSTSSLHTDINYQKTIASVDNYFPSPSIFVYTLANIMIGEIAIRHKLQGESSAYILPQFDAQRMVEVTDMMLARTQHVNKVLCGWADCIDDRIDVCMYSISKTLHPNALEWNADNVNYLRNQLINI